MLWRPLAVSGAWCDKGSMELQYSIMLYKKQWNYEKY